MDQKINTPDLNKIPSINWTQLTQLGLVRRINEEILHPLGLAVSYEISTGISSIIVVAIDGTFKYDTPPKVVMSEEDIRKFLKREVTKPLTCRELIK